MGRLIDSFWRAAAYCLHPRVIGLSLAPLVVMVVLTLGLAYFFWDGAVNAVFLWLESSSLIKSFWAWLQCMGLGGLKTVAAPLIVIFLATPAIVVITLLLVTAFMTPPIVALVGRRRFPALEKKHGGSMVLSIFWALGSTLLAVVALVISVPLWFVPPLMLVLPPLIWGWLTYRVMAFDALAEHASREERRELMRRHRMPLLAIGVVTGYLGAAPSLLWASAWVFAAFILFMIPLAMWIYTLVFAFGSLWFTHYCLAALEDLRRESVIVPPVASPPAQEAPHEPEQQQPPVPPA
jgi:hypothetical protein